MAKKESSLKNMVLTLFVITFIASSVLGIVNHVTKEPIAKSKAAKKNKAINAVVPEFDNDPSSEAFTVISKDGLGDLTFYPVKKNGELIATAVESFTLNGFGGKFKLMVGFLPDGTINDIEALEHKETAGLGDKMEMAKSDFHVQFQGKNPESFKLIVTKDGGDVDAITASTISSRAYCDAVQRAYDTFISLEGGK